MNKEFIWINAFILYLKVEDESITNIAVGTTVKASGEIQ